MFQERRPVVTLTTDFGITDAYVGIVKGVILSICPHATLVDISHSVPPQDVATAALILRQAAPYFPPETIHVAIVDPGVGTDRRAVAAISPLGVFVAPDNGILTGVLPAALVGIRAVHLNRPQFWLAAPGATFHGRDLFAPVAAYLAAGTSLLDVGQPIDPEGLVRLPWPEPVTVPGEIVGEIIHVDHFGNLVANIDRRTLERNTVETVFVGEREVGALVSTYGDRGPGQPAAYIGSSGLLEVAVVNCDASQALGAGKGTPVRVTVAQASGAKM
jgi:hypothetical protein